GGLTVAVVERYWVLLQLKRAALLYAHTSHRVAGHLLSESRTFVSGSQRLRRTQRLSAGPLAWPVSCATSAHAWVMGSRWMPFSFAARSATRRVISAALCCLLASSGSGGAVQMAMKSPRQNSIPYASQGANGCDAGRRALSSCQFTIAPSACPSWSTSSNQKSPGSITFPRSRWGRIGVILTPARQRTCGPDLRVPST